MGLTYAEVVDHRGDRRLHIVGQLSLRQILAGYRRGVAGVFDLPIHIISRKDLL